MRIRYSTLCSYTGIVRRYEAENVASYADEPYPPGGFLRVLRNASGQIMAGPWVPEILTFEVAA